MIDFLDDAYPGIGRRLPRVALAQLPTPVERAAISVDDVRQSVWIKRDDLSGEIYGGNKIRKLEYVLQRAVERRARRVATFGAVASNHALATAIYANRLGLDCTCLLSHQSKSDKTASVLRAHANLDSELVPYGGDYRSRIETMRRFVQGRRCWVIPVGGSSWLGSVGFVNAALELADQISRNELPCPDLLYVATGTMGTTAGIALGLALAGLPTEVQAIRVTDDRFANRDGLYRLVNKIATMLRMYGAAIPEDAASRVRLSFRSEFFAGGYARSDDATDRAVAIAAEQAGLLLETTYTGKAMAALLSDLGKSRRNHKTSLFWNTYSSRAMPDALKSRVAPSAIPEAFRPYLD